VQFGCKRPLRRSNKAGQKSKIKGPISQYFWMWAEVVGGMRFFYTQILEGSRLIAPLSNPNLTVTLIAIHS
jgi:hypothetical protein